MMRTGPMKRHLATALLATVMAAGLAAGCSSEAGDVSCNLNTCTVTLNRGVDASVSVLGADVKLVSVDNSLVTVDVEGNRVSLPLNGGQGTQVAGLNVTVQQVTSDKVVLQVTQQ